MRFGSVCSGIEAASVAWHPLGWEAAYVAEIEPFPCTVLAHRFGASEPRYLPEEFERRKYKRIAWGDRVANYGDFTCISRDPPAIDLLVGGTPCQAFSFAGSRLSLADARGNLALEYVRLVHAHASRTDRPLRWAVWENVLGVLSTEDNAFGCFLGGLVGADDPIRMPDGGRWPDSGMVSGPLGRAAWRVLDAQHFGLAQQRRRVFVVFCPRASRGDPSAILFERKSVRWDFAERKGMRKQAGEIVGTITTRTGNANDNYSAEQGHLIVTEGKPRWITPRECERLQGFPDDHTAIAWRGRPADKCPDGPRYKALGNSMAIPVMRWIGERIASVESGQCERGSLSVPIADRSNKLFV